MKNEQKQSRLPGLMALLVFALFAVCILLVLLTGGESYRKLTARGAEGFDNRTVCQYLVTRVHQADREDAISLEDFGGVDALVIREELEGKTYLTRIYCYEGGLWELFTPATGEFSPQDGDRLLDTASLDLQLEDGMLLAQIGLNDGSMQQLRLHLRSKGGGQ